jgi:type II secretory pathway component GspD/PulD (secretin)
MLLLLPASQLHGEAPPSQAETSQLPSSSAPPLRQAIPTPNTAAPNSHHQQRTKTAQERNAQDPSPVLPNASMGNAQFPQESRPSESAVHQDASAPVQVPRAEQIGTSGQVKFNFDDADLYSVIQTILGIALKVNYVIDQRVKGRVTFRSATPVARENILPLLEVILRLNGMAVVEDGGIYRILPIGEITREPAPIGFGRNPGDVAVEGKAVLQVVPVRHILSSELVRLIAPFVSSTATVVDVPKNNQIVVVDTDASVKRILQLVNIFDSDQSGQNTPQVFVHHVQNSKAKDLVSLLQQMFSPQKTLTDKMIGKAAPPQGQTARAAGERSAAVNPLPVPHSQSAGNDVMTSDVLRFFSDDLANTIIILGTAEDYEKIQAAIKKIDIVPRQVVIEGVIAQIGLSNTMNLGLAWSINANISDIGGRIRMNASSLDPAKIPGTGFTYSGTDAAGVVRAVISSLATESKAKLLATPHILVADNREARIQVGQSVPIPTSETFGTPGVAPQRTIQYKDIGIILKVKPRINDGGLVSLDIVQEVSTFSTVLLFSDEKQIILNKTEASTNLIVQDGQTIVIGGLIREDESKAKAGIPFLSKIPILGYLFGNTGMDESRTELIILLTPRVIKTQKDAAVATSSYVDRFTDTGAGGDIKIKKEELMKLIDLFKQDSGANNRQGTPTN